VVPLQVADPEEIEDPLRITEIVDPFTPVPETVVFPGQIGPEIVGAAETDLTVTDEEAALTHLPLSVCVAVKTSAELRDETVIVHVVPLQVADPEEIDEPLRITEIVDPFTPVPETVVFPAQ
jgi:hypothetical protein